MGEEAMKAKLAELAARAAAEKAATEAAARSAVEATSANIVRRRELLREHWPQIMDSFKSALDACGGKVAGEGKGDWSSMTGTFSGLKLEVEVRPVDHAAADLLGHVDVFDGGSLLVGRNIFLTSAPATWRTARIEQRPPTGGVPKGWLRDRAGNLYLPHPATAVLSTRRDHAGALGVAYQETEISSWTELALAICTEALELKLKG